MRNRLKLLEELQGIDLRIDGRQAEKDAMLQQVADLERSLEEARIAIDALRDEAALVRGQKEEIEATLAVESDNIVRSEARLHEIKTQKEYQAVQKEISSAKKIKTELEEQIIVKIGEIEALEQKASENEANLAALTDNIAGRKGEVQEQLDRLGADIAGDESDREAAVKELPPAIVKRYSMLREKRQGIAVVEARDGNCLGCNMNIPPQMYNNLYRADDMITCPHCQRILYLRQEQTAG